MPSDTFAICRRRNWRLPWHAASYCLSWTTATPCYMVSKPAAFRSYSTFRTPWHESFYRHCDSRRLDHSCNSYTHWLPVRQRVDYKLAVLTYKIWLISILHTSAITSHLGNLHGTSVLQPHCCYTDRLPELTSPTARSDALLLPSGTLWSLNTDTLCCSYLTLFKHSLKTFLFHETFRPSSSCIARL